MKRIISSTLLWLIVLVPVTLARNSGQTIQFEPHELLVKFTPGLASDKARDIGRQVGAETTTKFKVPVKLQNTPIDQWYHFKFSQHQSIDQARARLLKNPNVQAVEHNYRVTRTLTPNDVNYYDQWSLENTGQTGGVQDADIDAAQAWDIQTGSKDIIVAVIDTGVDYTHPDLAANIWSNRLEIPDNGLDDDNNGYVDDIHGYDFTNYDADPFDDHGHGTHVAGTIAAIGNNTQGVAGVNWTSSLMALKFLGQDGTGSTYHGISAILYAIDQGAHVLNNSWGGTYFSLALRDAIIAANDSNALFVAAAGNGDYNNVGYDIDADFVFPASHKVPNVVAVAASDANDNIAGFSNYGKNTVLLAAPGVDILSTVPAIGAPCCSDPSGYKLLSGTSMATPHVSGVAALIYAQYPGITVTQVKDRLSSVDPVANFANITRAGGRLNAINSLEQDDIAPAAITTLTVDSLDVNRVTLSWTATGDDFDIGRAVRYELRYAENPITPENFSQATLLENPPKPQDAGNTMWATVYGLTPNMTYHFAIKAYDNAGNASAISNVPSATLSPAIVVFHDDMESGDGKWIYNKNSLWHLSSHRHQSPNTALYYGSETSLNRDYGYNTTGSHIYTQTLDTRHVTGSTVAFSYSLQMGEGDSATLRLTGGVLRNIPLSNTGGKMRYMEIPASDFDGNVSEIRFVFTDSDYFATRDGEGLFIDDVLLFAYRTGPNQTPIADPGGPYDVNNTTDWISFDPSGSYDPDGDPITYHWDFGDGNVADGRLQSHQYNTAGVYTVTLTVSDGQSSAQSQTTVTVHNTPPIADAGGPYVGTPNVGVSFDGSNSIDPDGDSISYQWDFGDGTSGTGAKPVHVYNSEGVYTVTLTINDGIVNSLPTSTTVTVTNTGPIADPGGPYTGTHNVDVMFDGSASTDINGDPLSYQWDFGDGTTGTGANPLHRYTSVGIYTVALTVNDGRVSSTPVSTTVSISNQAPIANPGGPYTSSRNVAFDGSASTDINGDPLSYQWDFGDGTTGTGVTPVHHYAAVGTYTATLTVSDGSLTSLPVSTTVTTTNQAPIANPGGPYAGFRNVNVTFDGGASTDPDGDPLNYHWDFGDGTTGTGVQPTHSYSTEGSYTVTLTVDDGIVNSNPVSTTVTIVNQAPVANPDGPYSVGRNVPLLFDGSASYDSDGDALTYLWDFGDGVTASGSSPSHTYSSIGQFTVTLTVSDGRLNSLPVSTTVTVINDPPVVDIGGPYIGYRNTPRDFNGSASDPNGDALTYTWYFEGGATATGPTASRTFYWLGTFVVTLTVSDGNASTSATTTVDIINRAPIADPGGPYNASKNVPFTFNGSASTDPDGDYIREYRWDFGDGTTGFGSPVSHVFATPGVYTVELIVNDGQLDSTAATTTVTVVNDAPVANPGGSYAGFQKEPIIFDGSGSLDANGDSLTYRWDMGDGTVLTGVNPTHVYQDDGTYVVTLVVNDGELDSAPATKNVTVQNKIPFAAAGPDLYVGPRSTVNLSGLQSYDPDGVITTYTWTQVKGNVNLSGADTATPTFTAPNVSCKTDEYLQFKLSVTDDDGGVSAPDYVWVTVGCAYK